MCNLLQCKPVIIETIVRYMIQYSCRVVEQCKTLGSVTIVVSTLSLVDAFFTVTLSNHASHDTQDDEQGRILLEKNHFQIESALGSELGTSNRIFGFAGLWHSALKQYLKPKRGPIETLKLTTRLEWQIKQVFKHLSWRGS